ncbi:Rubisco LS methyltransferase, substrate-binding domain-containing protein [Cynara cardunculus var. scolymus]|uniref:Rubisco LS methyltransferase, substrate-binding domain-containing protein n=1 Tax=Cynara cardunculus var. scolymus TaxID=59895 RepID=A0A118K5Y1_CYNCS|nr:Rubisco LS methyltransferase, substrate-binding domain-containing protein [Cynara cardunculus var. scolymus]
MREPRPQFAEERETKIGETGHHFRHCNANFRCSNSTAPPRSLQVPPPHQAPQYVDEDCADFLPWLRQKAGVEISSVLSIGKSIYGRSLFACKPIQAGDCILKVPYSVQLAPDNLLPSISSLLGEEVTDVAKLALVILVHQKLGQASEWAPYISCLPTIAEMHSTIFWSDEELKMIRISSLYQETLKHKVQIEKDFSSIKHVLDRFPEFFEDVTLHNFKHAYNLVESRAWISTRGVSMIPFADFFNHDGFSETDVLSAEFEQVSEVTSSSLRIMSIHSRPFLAILGVVIADENYAPGDQVLIRYGKFSNARLLLDFGFILPCNKYDKVCLESNGSCRLSKTFFYQSLIIKRSIFLLPWMHHNPLVQVEVSVPHRDHLRAMKLDLLDKHTTPPLKGVNDFSSLGNGFLVMEVKSSSGKGRGIPQSLRALARVVCCTSSQVLVIYKDKIFVCSPELQDLATEATQNDGGLARIPLKNRAREVQAHQFLRLRFDHIIDNYNAALESLTHHSSLLGKHARRMQVARGLLIGELRVLESASAWLKNYCETLIVKDNNQKT